MQPFTRGIEKRTIIFFAGFVLLFSLLYVRLGYLSTSPGLMETAKNQSKYTLTVEEQRGQIYDCNLLPMVNRTSRPLYAVLPTSSNMKPVLDAVSQERRDGVSDLLQAAKPFLLQNDKEIRADNVTPFYQSQRYERYQLAPHIIGYLDSEKNGVTGIEKGYNDFLAQHTSKTQVAYTMDGMGHGMPGVEPEVRGGGSDPAGIVLSIDKDIQTVIQNEGNRGLKKGAIVVMDPYNGEIKGAASFPAFTPTDLSKSVQDTENSPMINRAFLPFNVGSTFKIVTAAAALEAGIPLSETATCTGSVDVSGQIIRCHKRDGHGTLDMLDAMKESCNPYFIHLGLKVGGDSLLSMAERFGFGQGYPLAPNIYTADGTLPAKQDMLNPAEVANLSFGQGKLTATPVQVAQMMSVVANGGYLVAPKLVLGETLDGQTFERTADIAPKQIISGEIASQIQSFLIHCVMVADGQNALPQRTTAGGKTGTAQTGRFDENENELEQGWFAGFFPASNPRYVVVVLSEETGYGNTTAAPVFSKIADALAEKVKE